MRIVWDEPKRLRNIRIHGLDFVDAESRFPFPDALIVQGHPDAHGRLRYIAIGEMDGDLVTLVFAPLGTEAIALISLRRASRKERKRHATR